MRGAGFALVGVALVVAALDWAAVARANRRAEYVLKPLTLALLIAAAISLKAGNESGRFAFTLAALAFSLAGDVLLMLPQDLFLAGLASFLVAHICYIAAFNTSAAPEPLFALSATSVAVVAVALYWRMRAGMVRSGRTEYALPVGIYVLAIGAMVASAVSTAGRADWSAARSSAAIAGALLFMASDSLIGWNRFVRPVSCGRVAVMATYHLGQALLVLGLLG